MPGTINTVAGGGTGCTGETDSVGDGCPAASADLVPESVALDSAGNMYIADYGNNRIRKVTVSTGIISTVAGTGTGGYNGDGIPATSAEIYDPYSVVLDAAGNIYIADYNNNRIRVVNTGTATITIAKVTIAPGDIATVAGIGPTNAAGGYNGDGIKATTAELNYPSGVAVDTAGNIYIADLRNYRIRKVTASTGIISTVAGTGTGGYNGDGILATTAEIDTALGVTVDSAANVYISDYWNLRIRVVNTGTAAITIAKVVIQPGDIQTVAGDGTAGYSGDGGAATSAELYVPPNTAIDSAGNIYIADWDNARIRLVTASTGIISTVAGDGIFGYSGDGGLATSAELFAPNDVIVNAAGNLYIADSGNGRIRTVQRAFISPSAAPVGASVTITGQNFGSTQGTVTFNGTKATSITSWSPTSIVVTVPTGATTGYVTVTAGGVPTVISLFTVVAVPSITSLSVTSGPPGQAVTITGTNFGSTQSTSAVLFNGEEAGPSSWTATSITVSAPSNVTTGPVVVVVNGLQSNGITFTDTSAPVITSISPAKGPAKTSVTINGSLFGSTQGSTSTVTFNGTTTTPTSWASGKIVAPAPTGVTTGNVVVTVGGIASNGMLFTVTPAITSISPTSGGVGTAVTITGTNFGTSQGSSTVKFGTKAGTPLTWSPTSIVVPVPSGAATGSVVVTVDSEASNGETFTVTSAPGISSISPTSGNAGTAVTITGSGFGTSKGSSTLTFNGVTATTISTWNNTTIQATVPAGGAPGPVAVTVNSLVSNFLTFFSPPGTPQITSLTFTEGPPQMGFGIIGTNFSSVSNQVTFNGVQIPILATIPGTGGTIQLIVQVPVGAPPNLAEVIVLAGPGPEYTPSAPAEFDVMSPPTCTLPLP